MSITLFLPNKNGNHIETAVPKYIEEILFQRVKDNNIPRIIETGPYRYRIYGYNPIRPGYGVQADIEKLNKWVSRYFCPIEDIKIHEERKNYYVDFTLYDPMAQQFERRGLIRRMAA